jgi:uncharacterized metal-binding protein YceD (DUF177 family)
VILPIESIPTRGVEVPLGPWARAGADEALAGTDAEVHGTLSIRRHDVHLEVRGNVSAAAAVPCDRCGAPLRLRVDVEVSCLYSPLSAIPQRAAGDDRDEPDAPVWLDPPVDELGEYDGVALDLGQVVRETLVVERPSRVFCADVDPGADAACQARWRDLAAALPVQTADPRFAVLRSFQADSKPPLPEK